MRFIMFDYDWTTDILPILQDAQDSSLVKGAIIFIIAISLVGYVARVTIGIFAKK